MTFKDSWRWWSLVLLLIAAAAGLLRWQPWREAGRPAPEVTTAPSALAMGWLRLTGVAASGAGGPIGTAPEAAASEPDAVVEVCDAGRVSRQAVENWNPLADSTEPPWMQALNHRGAAALSALAARLAVGADAEQVAARLLMGDAQGAALIASRSRDATAYRLALSRCTGAQAAPECRGLNNRGWAELDSGDGRPWLNLAAEAMLKRDEAAAAQALDQAMQRRRRSPSNPLLALAINARAGVKDEAGLGLAMIQVIGVDAAQPSNESMVSRYCSAEGVKDAVRRSRCERLARWQFEHADTVLDALIAIGIADRVGLPAEQRPYTREQLDRGMNRMIEESVQVIGFDCASLRRTADWVGQRTQLGELQMALKAGGAVR